MVDEIKTHPGMQNRVGFMGPITHLAADGLHYSNYGILRDASMSFFQGTPAPAQTMIAKNAPPPKASPLLHAGLNA